MTVRELIAYLEKCNPLDTVRASIWQNNEADDLEGRYRKFEIDTVRRVPSPSPGAYQVLLESDDY